MAFDVLRLPVGKLNRFTPVSPRLAPVFCFVLLTVGCVLASFALACATPFAAFAVLAAAILPLPAALVVTAAVWMVNQAVGFGMLGYPVNVDTILWGVAIGVAAQAATAISVLVLRMLPRTVGVVALGLALIGAYAAYEVVLFAATPILGGAGAFTLPIVGRLGSLSLLWLLGLVAACEVLGLLAALRRRETVS